MMKRHTKKIIFCIAALLIFVSYMIISYITIPTGKIEHLKLNSISSAEILVNKWYRPCYWKTLNNEACVKLQDKLNSLDLIEVKKELGESHSGNEYIIYLRTADISITGEYLSIHPQGTDDKVWTEYYIVDSGYSPITRNSDVSDFIDDLT